MDLFLRSSSSSCSCLFVRLFFFSLVCLLVFVLFVCLFVCFFHRNSTREKKMLSVEILVTLYTQSLRLTRGWDVRFTYKRDKKMKLRKNKTLQRKVKQGKRQLWRRGLNEREREREKKKKIQYEFYTMTLFDYNLQKQIYMRRQTGINSGSYS